MQKLSRLNTQHCAMAIANPKVACTTTDTLVVHATFGSMKTAMVAENKACSI
jgi:hypothetical protein